MWRSNLSRSPDGTVWMNLRALASWDDMLCYKNTQLLCQSPNMAKNHYLWVEFSQHFRELTPTKADVAGTRDNRSA